MHKLKSYVCNKVHIEGSIAEKYLANECLTFCSRYLHGIETKFNRVEQNYDGGTSACANTSQLSTFSTPGRHLGKAIRCELNDLHNAATFYVLQNCVNAYRFVE